MNRTIYTWNVEFFAGPERTRTQSDGGPYATIAAAVKAGETAERQLVEMHGAIWVMAYVIHHIEAPASQRCIDEVWPEKAAPAYAAFQDLAGRSYTFPDYASFAAWWFATPRRRMFEALAPEVFRTLDRLATRSKEARAPV